MKAKIKATGEIVEVTRYSYGITNPKVYSITFLRNGNYERIDNADEFEILSDQPAVPIIDWEQRRYEIAKEALQAIITSVFSNKEAAQAMLDTAKKNGLQSNEVESIMAITYADELIYQLKNTPVR